MEVTLDDGFSLKEAIMYAGGCVTLVVGWFWANPMKRIGALEVDLAKHKRDSDGRHADCKVEVLEFKNLVSERYSTKADVAERYGRLENSMTDGFREIKAVLNQQTLKVDENFRTLLEQINEK